MGIIKNLQNGFSDDAVFTDPALEAEILLTAIRSECKDDAEFAAIMEDAAVEMALYDLIPDADIATEAAKKIIIEDYKTAQFNRVTKRTCIRMAQLDGNADYQKYKKYRDLMMEAREKIYRKYESKAKTEAKRIIANSRNKAAGMNSNAGKDITAKMDNVIKKVNSSQR